MSNIINYLSENDFHKDFELSQNRDIRMWINLFNEKYPFSDFEIAVLGKKYFSVNILPKNNNGLSVTITNEFGEEAKYLLFEDGSSELINDLSLTYELEFTVYILNKVLNSHKEIIKIVSDIPREIKDNETQYKNTTQPILLDKGVVFTHIYDNVRHYERHTEAWSVRGFYRHYKSGKVVFIPPHTRGKGEIKDKNYII